LYSIVHFLLSSQSIPFNCFLPYSPDLFPINSCCLVDLSTLLHSTSCALLKDWSSPSKLLSSSESIL
jgi:hypothetical protein